MRMIEHLPELMDAGVTSFKIEGRMKSAYYAAAVTNAYRHAVDCAAAGEPLPEVWLRETDMLSHRPYCTGFYFGQPGEYYADATYFSDAEVCAVVEECDGEGNALLTQRNRFCAGDRLNLLTRSREPADFIAADMTDTDGDPIDSAPHPMMKLRMKLPFACERLSIVRKIKNA
jgi:U32 family peptidase